MSTAKKRRVMRRDGSRQEARNIIFNSYLERYDTLSPMSPM
jgi:hypothetical protein